MKLKENREFKIKDLGIQEDYVYDIEVENNHNFFANDILVHNSVYINVSEIVNKIIPNGTKAEKAKFVDRLAEEELKPYIQKANEDLFEYMNHREFRLNMDREMIGDKAIFIAKKRYAMNVVDKEGVSYIDEPYLKIMGIEVVRSSTPQVCRDELKEAIRLILQEDNKALIDHIQSFKERFKTLPPEVIAFPRGISDLNKYYCPEKLYQKKTPAHVRGSLLYNKLLTSHNLDRDYDVIKSGSKVKFVYLRTPNPIHENIIAFSEEGLFKEFSLHDYIDYQTQFEKAFLKPIRNLTDAIGWKTKHEYTLFG